MNKFQPVKFRNIGEFFDFIPENEREIVLALRQLILDSIPGCRERLAYNVPYYYLHSRICFIWPPSIPWGNTHIKGVQLGFCNGYLMKDELNFLEKGMRKQVYWKEFNSTREIEADVLKAYLFEAVEIDRSLYLKKSRG